MSPVGWALVRAAPDAPRAASLLGGRWLVILFPRLLAHQPHNANAHSCDHEGKQLHQGVVLLLGAGAGAGAGTGGSTLYGLASVLDSLLGLQAGGRCPAASMSRT